MKLRLVFLHLTNSISPQNNSTSKATTLLQRTRLSGSSQNAVETGDGIGTLNVNAWWLLMSKDQVTSSIKFWWGNEHKRGWKFKPFPLSFTLASWRWDWHRSWSVRMGTKCLAFPWQSEAYGLFDCRCSWPTGLSRNCSPKRDQNENVNCKGNENVIASPHTAQLGERSTRGQRDGLVGLSICRRRVCFLSLKWGLAEKLLASFHLSFHLFAILVELYFVLKKLEN